MSAGMELMSKWPDIRSDTKFHIRLDSRNKKNIPPGKSFTSDIRDQNKLRIQISSETKNRRLLRFINCIWGGGQNSHATCSP